MSHELSTGFCLRANRSDVPDDLRGVSPVLQILSIKQIIGGGSVPDRYRVIISDGAQFMQAMLATTLNEQIDNNSLRRNTVVRCTRWEPQILKGQSILILFELDPLDYPPEKIGNPVNVGKAATAADDAMAVDNKPPVAKSTSASVSAPAPAPAASRSAPAPAARTEMAAPVFPIQGLNPYHNKWTLKARVTSKSEKKRWSNAKGEGQLFSVVLMDETGEIKATAFNAAVDSLYDLLEEGRVYYITKGKVMLAKKAFSNLSNDYEITMDGKTEVTECQDAGSVPQVSYNFITLDQLNDMEKDAIVDTLAVVHKVGEMQDITTKAGKQLKKRDLMLVDKTGYQCSLTLWGKQAESWDHHDNPAVAFKGLKVGDFQGKQLSASGNSTMTVGADMPEAHNLKGWYDSEGKDASFGGYGGGGGGGGAAARNVTFRRDDMKTLKDVRDGEVGMRDTPDYFNTRATIITVRQENIAYPACKNAGCSKKVVSTGSGWRCEKCDQNWDEPTYRYLLSMQVADHTAQAWFSAFNDIGNEIIGMNADELVKIKDENEQEFHKVLHKVNSKSFNFSCRAKQETFNEQTRVKFGITKLYQLDYATECRNLHKLLSEYSELTPAKYLNA